MKTLISVISWMLGILVLLPATIASFADSIVAGVLLLLATLLTIPLTSKYIFKNLSDIKRYLTKGCLGFILVIVGISIAVYQQEQTAFKEAAEKEQLEIEEKTAYLKNNRNALMDEVFGMYDNGDYEGAYNLANEYRKVDDERIQDLLVKLETEKIGDYLKRNKNVSDSKYHELYKRLVELHPENALYKTAFDTYDKKVKEHNLRARVLEREVEELKAQLSEIRGIAGSKLGKVIDVDAIQQAAGQDEGGLLLDIEYEADYILTKSMTRKDIISGIMDFVKKISKNPEFQNYKIYSFKPYLSMTDVKGNRSPEQGAKIVIRKESIDDVNWGNMYTERFEKLLGYEGSVWWHSALRD